MTSNYNDDEQQFFQVLHPEIRKVQLFRVGAIRCGIFVDEIATVASWREPTPLPNAPKAVLGVVSLQGRMLTVLDLGSLRIADSPSGDNISSGLSAAAPQHLIALRGDEQLALAVDEVGETIKTGTDEFDVKSEPPKTLVLCVLHYEGSDIHILNLSELFPAAIQGRERRRRRF